MTNKQQTPQIRAVLGIPPTVYVCGNGCGIKGVLTRTYRVFQRMDTELMALIVRCLARGCGLYRSSVLLG